MCDTSFTVLVRGVPCTLCCPKDRIEAFTGDKDLLLECLKGFSNTDDLVVDDIQYIHEVIDHEIEVDYCETNEIPGMRIDSSADSSEECEDFDTDDEDDLICAMSTVEQLWDSNAHRLRRQDEESWWQGIRQFLGARHSVASLKRRWFNLRLLFRRMRRRLRGNLPLSRRYNAKHYRQYQLMLFLSRYIDDVEETDSSGLEGDIVSDEPMGLDDTYEQIEYSLSDMSSSESAFSEGESEPSEDAIGEPELELNENDEQNVLDDSIASSIEELVREHELNVVLIPEVKNVTNFLGELLQKLDEPTRKVLQMKFIEEAYGALCQQRDREHGHRE